MSHSIEVNLDRHEAYNIYFGTQLWDEVRSFCADHYSNQKAFAVVDARVFGLHGDKITSELEKYFQTIHVLKVPEGEKSKSIRQWTILLDEMLNNKVERATPLIAIGGGVTGDLAGFAAASVLRGVPLVHIPTSLLAMVDSSIGGKTGVNHTIGKNLIGAFYQPNAVFMDLEFLSTLERREWIGGLAEMLKYAAIQAPEMFEELEKAVAEGLEPSARWLNLIRQSAAIKADIVQRDEREAGIRAYLNFGHTFGHALERLAGYGKMSHGEAVFVGMLAAVHYINGSDASLGAIRFAPFRPLYDIKLPDKDRIPELIEAMHFDKKVKDKVIRLILLKDWGEPYIEQCQDESRLEDAWEAAFDEINQTE